MKSYKIGQKLNGIKISGYKLNFDHGKFNWHPKKIINSFCKGFPNLSCPSMVYYIHSLLMCTLLTLEFTYNTSTLIICTNNWIFDLVWNQRRLCKIQQKKVN